VGPDVGIARGADGSLSGSDDRPDPQEAVYLALHGEREALEHALTLARQQQSFCTQAEQVAEAREREAALLRDLDRVLTLIRAAEVRRSAGPAAKRWQ